MLHNRTDVFPSIKIDLLLAAFFLSEQNFIFYKAGDSYLSDYTTLPKWSSKTSVFWRADASVCQSDWKVSGALAKACCFRDSKQKETGLADSALEETVTDQPNKKMSIQQRSETSGVIYLLWSVRDITCLHGF